MVIIDVLENSNFGNTRLQDVPEGERSQAALAEINRFWKEKVDAGAAFHSPNDQANVNNQAANTPGTFGKEFIDFMRVSGFSDMLKASSTMLSTIGGDVPTTSDQNNWVNNLNADGTLKLGCIDPAVFVENRKTHEKVYLSTRQVEDATERMRKETLFKGDSK